MAELNEKIGGNCFLINQESFSNDHKFFGKILKNGFVSGNIMKTENVSTIRQFLDQVKTIEDCSRILFISPNEVETDEHFVVDVVGVMPHTSLIVRGICPEIWTYMHIIFILEKMKTWKNQQNPALFRRQNYFSLRASDQKGTSWIKRLTVLFSFF